MDEVFPFSVSLNTQNDLTWCEVNTQYLEDNIRALRRHLNAQTMLAPAVKSNAYGHDLLIAARAFLKGGADWLCVHTIAEAKQLRKAGIDCPIYCFGPSLVQDLELAAHLRLHLVLYQKSHLDRLSHLASHKPDLIKGLKVHLKIETGNHRQGLTLEQALEFTEVLKINHQQCLSGVSSHFANIEDTVNQGYAELQMSRLLEAGQAIESLWGQPLIKHIANSAATLLWPNRALDLARVGISAYGLWPSKLIETLIADQLKPKLKPSLNWRARIVQVKDVPRGEPIGYGCTYITSRITRLAVIPIGYYEGYDRGLSNRGEVLIRGQRAKILGRVCMNICMVDVTDIIACDVGDIATLLGESGSHCITADELGAWIDTINYEIVARIAGHIPRYKLEV